MRFLHSLNAVSVFFRLLATLDVIMVTFTDPLNATQPITNLTNSTIIEKKNVTLNGSAAVFSDDVLNIVIANDEESAEILRRDYLKSVELNNESSYTPLDFSKPELIYKAYGYSSTLPALFLDDSIKYNFPCFFDHYD